MILLLFALAAATPTITSITPDSAPVAGRVHVTVRGTGFVNICTLCSPAVPLPPAVSFGSAAATQVTFIDSTRLDVIAPPHLPGPVGVTVDNRDGTGRALIAFTFTGSAAEAFEPLLFPVFSKPVKGQFSSEFHTTARVYNSGLDPQLFLFGQDLSCLPIDPQPPSLESPQRILDVDTQLITDCTTSYGRVLWTHKGHAAALAANIRVADVTREATSHGTEIPVVRAGDFTTGAIALLGVPTDPRFRLTLRVYSLASTSGPVNIEGYGQVFLTPGRDLYEPSYAEVGNLPRTLSRVVIRSSGAPIWAFITVTNNETQQITTITPQ